MYSIQEHSLPLPTRLKQCAQKNKAHKSHGTVVISVSKNTAFLKPVKTGHTFLSTTQKPIPKYIPNEKRSGGWDYRWPLHLPGFSMGAWRSDLWCSYFPSKHLTHWAGPPACKGLVFNSAYSSFPWYYHQGALKREIMMLGCSPRNNCISIWPWAFLLLISVFSMVAK